jgi:hypothetical protein
LELPKSPQDHPKVKGKKKPREKAVPLSASVRKPRGNDGGAEPKKRRPPLKMARGAQRRRGGGGMTPLRGPRNSGEGGGKEYTGSLEDDARGRPITSDGCYVEASDGRLVPLAIWIEQNPPKPLPATAIKLLIRFHRLLAYREAIADGVHDQLARRIFFEDVEDRQVRTILSELGDDDPHTWFLAKIGKEIGAGRIPGAREVAPCPDAEAFYIALAGGKPEYDYATARDSEGFRMNASGRVNGERRTWYEREAATYSVFSLFR